MSSAAAYRHAQEKGLDLVEVHDKSKPPVCKIMDYGKWKFETKKKEKQNKKNQTKVLVKEIQIRTRTDEGDIKIKLDKAREFLKQGHKVKINLRFFGREMAHKDLGFKLLKQLEERLSDAAGAEMPAKMERRTLFLILAPLGSPSLKKAKPSAEEPAGPARPIAVNLRSPAAPLKPSAAAAKPDSAAPSEEKPSPLDQKKPIVK